MRRVTATSESVPKPQASGQSIGSNTVQAASSYPLYIPDFLAHVPQVLSSLQNVLDALKVYLNKLAFFPLGFSIMFEM